MPLSKKRQAEKMREYRKGVIPSVIPTGITDSVIPKQRNPVTPVIPNVASEGITGITICPHCGWALQEATRRELIKRELGNSGFAVVGNKVVQQAHYKITSMPDKSTREGMEEESRPGLPLDITKGHPPRYNPALHGPGAVVTMPNGAIVTVKEVDADGNEIPFREVSTGVPRLVRTPRFTHEGFRPDPKPEKKVKKR